MRAMTGNRAAGPEPLQWLARFPAGRECTAELTDVGEVVRCPNQDMGCLSHIGNYQAQKVLYATFGK